MSQQGSQQVQPDGGSHWAIIQPVKLEIYLAMAIAVVSVALSLAALYTLAFVIKAAATTAAIPWSGFLLALGFTVLAYGLRGLSFKRSHLAAFALEPLLRWQISQRLGAVPLGTLTDEGSGALSKVILDDVRELHAFVADSTPLYARSYAAPLMSLALLFYVDWRLALVALAVLLVGGVILGSVMKNSAQISRQYNEARETVSRAVIEFVQAMPVVRTFDGGRSSFGRYENALDSYLGVLLDWYRRNGPAARLSMIILNPMPTLVALLWAGTYWLWRDSLEFSSWLAILLLGTGMAEALMPYMALYHLIEKAKISVDRIQQILALASLPVAEQLQQPEDAEVVFDKVDFSYPNRSDKALANVSFRVPAGSFTALVGPSGAGKSTVARLLPRFWDVSGGCVKVGGVDVRAMDPAVLMQQVAFVFQDTFLFSASILDNIRLGQSDKTLEQVITAAKAAQAHEFIQALPQGYVTPAGERGARLSGGQRQRITIARAILQNRPILVLDEASAFADAENEALLMQALQALMRGKTVLMIAHRLATVQNADQILVFEQGRLVEAGAPAELLQQGGAYAKLWQAYQSAQRWTIRTQAGAANS